ncbi:phosphodiester glycosidase family protein [Verrucomicrobium sp. BvORR034]|uniref:phosphodiester glycosidase family protein n=1 Tax=Verrucomicrobium sp. BvORR034 TaxID=1396418 RepID=UPI0009DFA115|nr:phosphodiester glycosidase family protein [Verrucomicrobium sp. BvORR034]
MVFSFRLTSRLAPFLLLMSAMVETLPAQWTVRFQSAAERLSGGAVQVKKQLAGPTEADLNLILFTSGKYDLRVISQPDRAGAVSLATKMKELGAVAGCNGGYFTPEFQPLGLEISNGARAGAFQRSSLLGGVFVVRNGRPTLMWKDEYSDLKGTTQLFQAGPRLVDAGQPVAGLEATKRRVRTFILTDQAGSWAIGTCKSVTLRELSDLLATRAVIPEIAVKRALNFDGGSSTGLWWRTEDGQEHSEREFSRVRNFLVVMPRTSGPRRSS